MAAFGPKVISAFFHHVYSNQWHYANFRYHSESNEEILPYEDEYIKDPAKDLIWKDGEIIAVHCSRYTYDGTLLIYQGYWTNKQYSHDGILYYESLQKENLFMQYLLKQQQPVSYPVLSDVSYYKGTFENGKENGYGEWYDGRGIKRYEGSCKDGKIDGSFISYYSSGKCQFKGNAHITDGPEKSIIRYGNQCEEYHFSGFLLWKGSYQDNHPCGCGLKYFSPFYCQQFFDKEPYHSEMLYIPREDLFYEDIHFGDFVEVDYSNEQRLPLCDSKTGFFTPLLSKKAYVCMILYRV